MIDMDLDGKGFDLHPQSLWKTAVAQYTPLERLIAFRRLPCCFTCWWHLGGDSRLTLTQCRLVFWDSEHMCFGGVLASRGILKVPTKADEACLHSPKKFPEADETSKRSMCGFFYVWLNWLQKCRSRICQLPIAPSPPKKLLFFPFQIKYTVQ